MSRAVLVLGLVLLVPGADGASRAQPVQAVHIVAIGDFGVGGHAQRQFGEAVRRFAARNRVDVLLTLGDNDYTENPRAFSGNWEASFGWAKRAGVRVRGVLGNHDVRVGGGRYEFDELGMPGRYFRFALGPVEAYHLDSNDVDPAQTSWLRRTLARSRARWRIAVTHHPPYTCGKYLSHPEVVSRWVPLFERSRVSLVLSGHDHNYQRFAPRRGVRYVVHGGGGAGLYTVKGCPTGYPTRRAARAEHGFLYLVVRPNRLDGYAVDLTGRRTDHFTLRR